MSQYGMSARYAARLAPEGTVVRFTYNAARWDRPESLTTVEGPLVRRGPDTVSVDLGTHAVGAHISRIRGWVERVN
jgi:hypothetical protein